MVLERIFPASWLEEKEGFAFVLGISYSIVSILLAKFLFPKDPALVAVAFTAILLLPELYKIFSVEEHEAVINKRFSWRNIIKDVKGKWDLVDITKIYIYLFLGILLTYSLGAILLPTFQTNELFREQLEIRGGAIKGQAFETQPNAISGQATTGYAHMPGLFKSLLKNNFKVMVVCFIVALLAGNGAIFIITWNASVWGTIFGVTAKCAAHYAGYNPLYVFFLIMFVVGVHMMLEAVAYFLAAASGSILSRGFLKEKMGSAKFNKIFKYSMFIILIALGFLLAGAAFETLVLKNITLYHEIIKFSFLAGC